MCTVSVVPRVEGFRIVCNRDEKRTRPAALPPVLRRRSGMTTIWPVDPASGGTWIGANDAGLAMVLLNRTPPRANTNRRPPRSRGTVIPNLLQNRSVDGALGAAADLSPRAFEPFTLVILQGRTMAVLTNEDGRMSVTREWLTGPVVFSSSSLGDDLVVAPRLALFARMVEAQPWPRVFSAQAAFHRHRWRRRPAISVVMTRPDAATVSRTILDLDAHTARMRYRAVPEAS